MYNTWSLGVTSSPQPKKEPTTTPIFDVLIYSNFKICLSLLPLHTHRNIVVKPYLLRAYLSFSGHVLVEYYILARLSEGQALSSS